MFMGTFIGKADDYDSSVLKWLGLGSHWKNKTKSDLLYHNLSSTRISHGTNTNGGLLPPFVFVPFRSVRLDETSATSVYIIAHSWYMFGENVLAFQ